MTETDDRRRAPRARFSGITMVRAEGFDIYCVGGDVSESGMLLFPTRPPPVIPRHLRVTFALPTSARWLVAEAELVRQKLVARRTMWAVRFTVMDEETRSTVRAFIRDNDVSGSGPAALPDLRAAELRPLPRSETTGQRRTRDPVAGGDRASPGPDVDIFSLEAEARDPDTLTLSSEEIGQLAAASLLVDPDEELPPPLPTDLEDDEIDEEADTEVRVSEVAGPERTEPPGSD